MKLSNLIAELQSIEDKHGDIEVKVENPNHHCDESNDINVIRVFNDASHNKFVYIN